VGVEVECGGDAAVAEAARDDQEWHPGQQHLGGHEVPKVVESEGAESGCREVALKCFGCPVRFPGRS
jgi:hypothetical protein